MMFPNWSRECAKHKAAFVEIVGFRTKQAPMRCPVCVHLARIKVKLERDRFDASRNYGRRVAKGELPVIEIVPTAARGTTRTGGRDNGKASAST